MTFISRSQNFEDVILNRALSKIDNGFYVDIGAAWSDKDSVTYNFYKRGWHGINVEPNTYLHKLLQQYRTRDINLCLAVAGGEVEQNFYIVRDTGLSTLNSKQADLYKKMGFAIEEVLTKTIRLERLLSQYAFYFNEIHFIKIDAGGCEFEVVMGNDWFKYRPWIVLIEAFSPLTQIEAHHEWESCLLKSNYIHVYNDGLNRFYVAEEHSELIGCFKYPPNVFDDFALFGYCNQYPTEDRVEAPASIILPRQMLVDVSILMSIDRKTGIQRVVRAILSEWLASPPSGFRIEPVYATKDEPYRYARSFTASLLGYTNAELANEFVTVKSGDVFVGLDLTQYVTFFQRTLLEKWHNQGVRIWFVVYDFLPIQLGLAWKDTHQEWLRIVCQFDGVACISQSVADEVRDWLSINGSGANPSLQIQWFHLGADISASLPTLGVPENSDVLFRTMQSNLSFLMVGTIEPRKGHMQVIDAFEQIWSEGQQNPLIIVGKIGWDSDILIDRLRNHPKQGKLLFWLDEASDEYLEHIYSKSACLVYASIGEGFGLPLIEAAQHRLPVIARDLSVFQEIAGDHAFYFHGDRPFELAEAIKAWIELYRLDRHPKSDKMPWLTWKESANMLSDIVCKG